MSNKNNSLPDDQEIIQIFWARDEEAIRITDEKYGKYLKVIARNIVSDQRDAEECMSDVYLHVWNAIPPARPVNYLGYLVSTVRRTAISLNRKKNSEKRGKDVMELPWDACENEYSDGSDFTERVEKSAVLNEFICALPGRQRYYFLGRYYLGRTVRELAKETNVSAVSVYRELKEIKEDLKKKLKEGGYEA